MVYNNNDNINSSGIVIHVLVEMLYSNIGK